MAKETTKVTALKEKVDSNATMEKFKGEFEVKNISLEASKAETETSLKTTHTDLEKTERISQKKLHGQSGLAGQLFSLRGLHCGPLF